MLFLPHGTECVISIYNSICFFKRPAVTNHFRTIRILDLAGKSHKRNYEVTSDSVDGICDFRWSYSGDILFQKLWFCNFFACIHFLKSKWVQFSFLWKNNTIIDFRSLGNTLWLKFIRSTDAATSQTASTAVLFFRHGHGTTKTSIAVWATASAISLLWKEIS